MTLKSTLPRLVPYLGLVFAVAFFSVVSEGRLLGAQNLVLITNQTFVLILVALGASFIYAHGGMDLSLGATLACSALGAAAVYGATHSVPLAIGAGMAISLGTSMLVGAMGVAFAVPVFIITLCVQFIGRGVVTSILSSSTISMPAEVTVLFDNFAVKGIVLAVALAIVYLLFEHTTLGTHNKAIGGNPAPVQQSGISVAKYQFLAFTVSGLFLGVASFFALCRVGSVTASTGQGFEMDVILALVFGGMPLAGGAKSRISAAVIGSFMIYIVTNGFVLWGVDVYWVQLIKGLLLLVIVWISYEKKKGILVR